ncbi:MAG: hypothetical protein SFV54_23930 [Bryobacteraceae bacterium]|nr:hypothetical protein [Bryobacteraceae bacterium]
MKKARPLALVGAGPAEGFSLVRRPGILMRLGPVKSSSYRLASRIANALRHGFAVRECDDLDEAGVILLCAPDTQLSEIVDELAASGRPWRGRTVIVCGSGSGSEVLAPLAQQGAAVGSVCQVGELTPPRYLAEGDRPALREVRGLFTGDGSRLIEINKGMKRECMSVFANLPLMLPSLIDDSIRRLAGAGLDKQTAAPIIERLLMSSVRGCFKGSRRTKRIGTNALAARS